MGPRGPSFPAKNSSRSSMWDPQPLRGWWLRPPCAGEPTGSCPAAPGSPAAAAPSACGGWQRELGCPYLPAGPQEPQSALGTGAWCSPSPSASSAAPLCSLPPRLRLEVRETGRSVALGPSSRGLPLPHLCSSRSSFCFSLWRQIGALCWSQVDLGMPDHEHERASELLR